MCSLLKGPISPICILKGPISPICIAAQQQVQNSPNRLDEILQAGVFQNRGTVNSE